MKKIIYLIFLLFTYANLFSQSSDDNIIASRYNVLPVPEIFSTYLNDTIEEKLKERTLNVENHLKSSSDYAWKVYSDRKDNVTYHDARKREGEEKDYKLDFMESFYVKAVKRNMVHLVIPTSKKKFQSYGWIDANRLILGKYCALSEKGSPEKRMILTSTSDLDRSDPDKAILKGLKDKNYFYSPSLESKYKSTKLAAKFEILFVVKETKEAVFLSRTDQIKNSRDVYGWISKVKTTHWNHRVCLEPVSGRRVVDRFCVEFDADGKCIEFENAYVFLEPYNLERYFENAAQVKKDWVLHSIPLRPKRMNANRMRYPLMEWSGKGYNKQKIAVIAEFGDDVDYSAGDGEDKIGKESLLQRQLDSIIQLQDNVNVMIVLDGTSSMDKFGPAVAKSINDIIKNRKLAGETSNKKIRWGLSIYRDYEDGDRLFELIPITESYQRVVKKLSAKSIKYSSKAKSNSEAHYYGMTQALKNGGFKKGQSNVLVLVGDAGNHLNDEKGLNRQNVIDLIVEKNVNVISFQVNYLTGKAKKVYQKFNSDSRSYILESGKKQLLKQKGSRSKYFAGLKKEKSNSFSVAYDGYGFNENWPTFGIFNHAMPGEQMDVGTFSKNLTNSFANYMSRLEKWTNSLGDLSAGTDEVYQLMDDQEKLNFDLRLRDICDRLNLTVDQCEMLKNEGQISIAGFVHTTIKGQKVLTEVAYMSKNMKRQIDDRLNRLANVRGGSITKLREDLYTTIVMIVQGLVTGSDAGEEIIGNWTFDEVWDIILGVPFSSNSTLKYNTISSIRNTSEISNDEIKEFVEGFVSEVDRFIDFPKEKDRFSSVFRKNGQEYYWIPIQKIPRGDS